MGGDEVIHSYGDGIEYRPDDAEYRIQNQKAEDRFFIVPESVMGEVGLTPEVLEQAIVVDSEDEFYRSGRLVKGVDLVASGIPLAIDSPMIGIYKIFILTPVGVCMFVNVQGEIESKRVAIEVFRAKAGLDLSIAVTLEETGRGRVDGVLLLPWSSLEAYSIVPGSNVRSMSGTLFASYKERNAALKAYFVSIAQEKGWIPPN